MKSIISVLALLASFSSFACLDISGKYLCPEEAATNVFALGAREVQFSKSPYVDMYTMKVGSDATIFEVGAWNPAMNPDTGEIDFTIETMAECKQDSVLLNYKFTENDGDIKVSVTGTYEITPTKDGIKLRSLLDGDEFFNFECSRQ